MLSDVLEKRSARSGSVYAARSRFIQTNNQRAPQSLIRREVADQKEFAQS
jgi:hypothetical protein